jgi:5,5'-dehydrodivanillate O-demethylase
MLSREQNESLTRVSKGTPGGELLRRYWMPIAIAGDLDKHPVKSVRILGEDLVLYQDKSGNLGLVDNRCPHRRASLAYAIPEEEGIRCPYHGWQFNHTGDCMDQPAEPPDSTFRDRCSIKAYPVEEMGGLYWAYMGPAPAPELPRFDLFVSKDAIRDIGYAMIPCNWFQCMENSMDPTHLEHLHGRYYEFYMGQQGEDASQIRHYAHQHHVKIGFDVFEFGIIKRRLLEGQTEESDDWKVGHPVIFPNILRHGSSGRHTFEIRVPVDDTHTWHLWYTAYFPGAGVELPQQDRIPAFEVPIRDEKGQLLADTIAAQDVMVWITQGEIADRDREKLGTSDKGVILLRQVMKEQMLKVQKGEDPLGVIRKPIEGGMITLPTEENAFAAGDLVRSLFAASKYSPLTPLVQELFAKGASARH